MSQTTDVRTIETSKGTVEAKVYWDGQDPTNEGYAYRITYPDGREETGACDAADPWDDVYEFLDVSRATKWVEGSRDETIRQSEADEVGRYAHVHDGVIGHYRRLGDDETLADAIDGYLSTYDGGEAEREPEVAGEVYQAGERVE